MKWHQTTLKWLDRITKGVSVVFAGLAKANIAAFPALLSPLVEEVQSGLWIPAALIAAPLVSGLRRRADNGKLDQVHELLDQIREATFKNQTFDLEQHARVTLFRYRKTTWRRFPYVGGWLIPIERSGSATRNTSALFRAHDDGEKCGGIAGRAWSKRSTIYVPELPNLLANDSPQARAAYAEKTFMLPSELCRDRVPRAQSLLGMPVEISGRKWGVIVVDSVAPTLNRKSAEKIFKDLNPTLTSLLKGL